MNIFLTTELHTGSGKLNYESKIRILKLIPIVFNVIWRWWEVKRFSSRSLNPMLPIVFTVIKSLKLQNSFPCDFWIRPTRGRKRRSVSVKREYCSTYFDLVCCAGNLLWLFFLLIPNPSPDFLPGLQAWTEAFGVMKNDILVSFRLISLLGIYELIKRSKRACFWTNFSCKVLFKFRWKLFVLLKWPVHHSVRLRFRHLLLSNK